MSDNVKKPLERDPGDIPGPQQVYDIVPLHNDSGIDAMTKQQRSKVNRFYELLANAMPLEGRDYTLAFNPLPDGMSVGIRITGRNRCGKAFAEQVIEYWNRFGGIDSNV